VLIHVFCTLGEKADSTEMKIFFKNIIEGKIPPTPETKLKHTNPSIKIFFG